MNEEQMGLLAKMKAMVEQKEALEREERQRAEALRAEMAKLEQLKALQQQQQAMLREQQAEADAQAQAMGQPPDAAQYDEYDDDDDEVNPYVALQVLEGLKAQLAQLRHHDVRAPHQLRQARAALVACPNQSAMGLSTSRCKDGAGGD